MSETIVDVRDLRKVYNAWSWRGHRRVSALNGATLSAAGGEVFGLLGPNGAGKTTLIKILLGVVRASGGSGALFGQKLGSAGARIRVGYLPESLRIDRHHNARTALHFYGCLSRMSGGQIRKRSDELLELVGLRDRDQESVRQFSKGMYQRLGLAQALLHDPDLLVLDEPTDGLDPVGRSDVRQVIERLRDQGKTIFLNSHILQEVELVCSRVAIMAKGRVRGMGTLTELSGPADQRKVEMIVSQDSVMGADRLIDEEVRKRLHFDGDTESQVEVECLDSGGRNAKAKLTMTVKAQREIDRLVDAMRGASISIEHLSVRQASLEETFMRLVAEADQESSQNAEDA